MISSMQGTLYTSSQFITKNDENETMIIKNNSYKQKNWFIEKI